MPYAKKYFDLNSASAFAGARHLLRVGKNGKALSEDEKNKIYEWLSNQDAYTLHRPVKRRFRDYTTTSRT